VPALAIVNARVWTGDARRPWVDALLVRDGRIAILGSSAEVKKGAGSDARAVDAKGMMVTSGFMGGDGEGIVPVAGRMLRAGSPAEFVILDHDITRASPEEIRDTRVMLTMMAGRVTYDRLNLVLASAT
jgi:predicted amidohydrolase YtcJ